MFQDLANTNRLLRDEDKDKDGCDNEEDEELIEDENDEISAKLEAIRNKKGQWHAKPLDLKIEDIYSLSAHY